MPFDPARLPEYLAAAVDAAAKESLSKADQKALDVVRKQYAAFKVLTKGHVTEAGNVSPARLATALRQQNPTGFKTGTINSDLMDIPRIGQAFKPVAKADPDGDPRGGGFFEDRRLVPSPSGRGGAHHTLHAHLARTIAGHLSLTFWRRPCSPAP